MTPTRDVTVTPPKPRLNFSRLHLASKLLYAVRPYSHIGQAAYLGTTPHFTTKFHAQLLSFILKDEIERLKCWNDPVNPNLKGIPTK
jgi:hypothetical protein